MGKPKMWNISRIKSEADENLEHAVVWSIYQYVGTYHARLADVTLGSFDAPCKISDVKIFKILLL